MKTFCMIFAAAGLSFTFATPVSALPVQAAGSLPPDLITQVAGGCGAGWHRGPYGGCRRNYANPGAHACPRGYHVGPDGRCRGNGR